MDRIGGAARSVRQTVLQYDAACRRMPDGFGQVMLAPQVAKQQAPI